MKIVQMFGLSILMIVLVVKVNTQLRETRFIKSVFEKSSSSVTSRYSTSLSNMNSKYQCAVACSSGDMCTRFEFCPNSPSDKCILYQSGSTCYKEHNEKTNAGCKCFRMKWLRYENESCRCPVGYHGNGDQCCQHVIQDCSEGVTDTLDDRKDVITFIKPLSYSGEPFEVLCSFSWGGVTKFQKRKKVDDATDFNTNWMNYRNGFGTFHGNFWLGLEKMYHILQNNNPNGFDLHIHLFNESYSHCMWYIGKFNLGGESSNYTATFQIVERKNDIWCDGMLTNLSPDSRPFSTYDHISYSNDFNCTGTEESGWWFADDVDCSFSNLNSKRIDGDIAVKTANVATIKVLELVMQVLRRS